MSLLVRFVVGAGAGIKFRIRDMVSMKTETVLYSSTI
jgi:hypothetical protein